eukprot:1848448-Prymnesium_polylepis.1
MLAKLATSHLQVTTVLVRVVIMSSPKISKASARGKFGTSNAADWYTFEPLRGFRRVAICCANSITYLSRATTQKPKRVAISISASICGSLFCTGA